MNKLSIRYWNSAESSPAFTSSENQTNSSFGLTLLDTLGGGLMNVDPLYRNSFFGYDLNSPEQLREASKKAKSMGMEKVLAAQLASPLPFVSRRDRDNNGAIDGLSTMTRLTIQLQMEKARKVIDQMSVNNRHLQTSIDTESDSENSQD